MMFQYCPRKSKSSVKKIKYFAVYTIYEEHPINSGIFVIIRYNKRTFRKQTVQNLIGRHVLSCESSKAFLKLFMV